MKNGNKEYLYDDRIDEKINIVGHIQYDKNQNSNGAKIINEINLSQRLINKVSSRTKNRLSKIIH